MFIFNMLLNTIIIRFCLLKINLIENNVKETHDEYN